MGQCAYLLRPIISSTSRISSSSLPKRARITPPRRFRSISTLQRKGLDNLSCASRVTHRQRSRREQLLHALRQLHQAQKVRDRRALFADLLRDLFLRQSEFFVQLVIGVRFFDRVEVLALDVLDERELQGVAVGRALLDDDRYFAESRFLRRAEAALAGDQPVLVIADARNDERLHDAVLANAARQLFDRRFIKSLARLIRVRRNLLHRHLGQSTRLRRFSRTRRDQRSQSSAECLLLPAPL